MLVKSNIKVNQISLGISVYKDGSVDVKIPADLVSSFTAIQALNVIAVLKCPAGLLALRYFLDYIEDRYPLTKVRLIMPYIPNGRQDRINGNDAVINTFSLKSVCNLLKSPCILSCNIVDPHSEVTTASLDKVWVLPQDDVFSRLKDRYDFECDAIVAPDAGAFKKSANIAKQYNLPLILATKQRDPVTNLLTRTELVGGEVVGKHVVIVDDILDGGRTFANLAKELKEQGASKVSLFITHGIFSYGYESLKEHLDEIFVYYMWLPTEEVDTSFIKIYLEM